MPETRIPIQKRSIEKRNKIISAGFSLFCKKGYYKTNTTEIAKKAGVSTGALYSYFADKRQIFIEAFRQYLDTISAELLHNLTSTKCPFNLSLFVENWISKYVYLYSQSGRVLVQLRLVIADDAEINQYFSELENTYFSNIANILKKNGIECDNLFEKVYIACVLIDSLRQEKNSFSHKGLDYDVLKIQIKESIINMLST